MTGYKRLVVKNIGDCKISPEGKVVLAPSGLWWAQGDDETELINWLTRHHIPWHRYGWRDRMHEKDQTIKQCPNPLHSHQWGKLSFHWQWADDVWAHRQENGTFVRSFISLTHNTLKERDVGAWQIIIFKLLVMFSWAD